jgi:hypothetical protein
MLKKHTYGIRFEKHKTKRGTRYKCEPFDIVNGEDCKDCFQGDYTLGGVQIIGTKRCSIDYAERWNRFFEMKGMLYSDTEEPGPVREAYFDFEHDYGVATIYKSYEGAEK